MSVTEAGPIAGPPVPLVMRCGARKRFSIVSNFSVPKVGGDGKKVLVRQVLLRV